MSRPSSCRPSTGSCAVRGSGHGIYWRHGLKGIETTTGWRRGEVSQIAGLHVRVRFQNAFDEWLWHHEPLPLEVGDAVRFHRHLELLAPPERPQRSVLVHVFASARSRLGSIAARPSVVADMGDERYVIHLGDGQAQIAAAHAGVLYPPQKMASIAAMGHAAYWTYFEPDEKPVTEVLAALDAAAGPTVSRRYSQSSVS